MSIKNTNFNKGFTLIEVMIAITLFTIIMTIGTGAVLQTNTVHKKTQAMRSVMDNLNFIIEDMARNLRLGGDYQCPSDFTLNLPTTITIPLTTKIDCSDEKSIAFESVDGGTPIVYTVGQTAIYKSKNGGDLLQITPDEVVIDPVKSGFTVVGALNSANQPDDQIQPRVIIRLVGSVKYKDLESSFNLETTISQRFLDN